MSLSTSPSISTATVPLPALNRRADRKAFASRLIAWSFVGDVAVSLLMLVAAYLFRFEMPVLRDWVPAEAMGVDMQLSDYTGHIFFGVTLMALLLVNFRAYNPHQLLSLQHMRSAVVSAAMVWVVAFMGVSLILKFEPALSRLYCAIGFLFCLVGLLVWRGLLHRLITREGVARRLRERVLAVGWTEDSGHLVRLLTAGRSHQYEFVGVLEPAGGFGKAIPDVKVRIMGGVEKLRDQLSAWEIDAVLVFDINLSRDALCELAVTCEKEMVDFKVVPSCFQILLSGLHLESVAGIPMLGVSRLPLHNTLNQYLKRTVDIVGGAVGLILSAPIIACFGLMVWLESRGPVFYRQIRVGQDGRQFGIWKIRSMRMDSEADGKAGWTVKDDPRCLRVGAFMRKWNIDEVPQFWNILTGDMSLVGPRPERPELITEFKEVIPHYNARHDVKPGLTGWAQVNGFRGNTDLHERIKADLHYIENWNLFWDFRIMILTFFRRENAC